LAATSAPPISPSSARSHSRSESSCSHGHLGRVRPGRKGGVNLYAYSVYFSNRAWLCLCIQIREACQNRGRNSTRHDPRLRAEIYCRHRVSKARVVAPLCPPTPSCPASSDRTLAVYSTAVVCTARRGHTSRASAAQSLAAAPLLWPSSQHTPAATAGARHRSLALRSRCEEERCKQQAMAATLPPSLPPSLSPPPPSLLHCPTPANRSSGTC